MIIPDVNLLLYAVIDAFPQHDRAHTWLENVVNGPDDIGLAAPAVFGFLRLSTNRRVLTVPLGVDAAIGYVNGWLERDNVEFVRPGPRHLAVSLELLAGVGAAGNLTTDVQLAAHAIEHDATLCSNDVDFARFAGLRWSNPLTAR